MGSTRVVEQFSFSMFPSILTFDFDLLLGSLGGLKLKLDCSIELPVIWLLSTSLILVWNAKNAGKDLTFAGFNAEVQAGLAVLKGTRWRHYALHNSTLILQEMLEEHLWILDRPP